ncbi:Acid sphingomyelinase-like phosphodiesterase 3a [Eufriesea mexicana]|nr:Acid sphingomyelinase-like phosphodiesterase 3a [Eufriesea mexicana]
MVTFVWLGLPVSWIMMAPSISPNSLGGPSNPGLRLYKFETTTGQVLDYTQYYLNLPDANSIGTANWLVEYSLLEYYDLQEITAITLHDLADRFTQFNDHAFVRYYAANTVSLPREVEQIWGCGGPLNEACALHHYCTVTRLNPKSYRECYSLYAYALASTGPSTPQLYFSLHLLVLMVCAELLRNRKDHECAGDPPATPFEGEASSTGRPGHGRRSSLLWGPRSHPRSCQPPMGKPISLWKPWAPKDRASHKLIWSIPVIVSPVPEAGPAKRALLMSPLAGPGRNSSLPFPTVPSSYANHEDTCDEPTSNDGGGGPPQTFIQGRTHSNPTCIKLQSS